MIHSERMAAVVIGRNEGQRLSLSLRSVQNSGLPIVYADSGSSDKSPGVANDLSIPLVELDPSRPFSAARGRNEGLKEARRRWPNIKYILFLDGDCILESGFPGAAEAIFEMYPECAIVTGHLSEQSPEFSIYNRLCAIEWKSPAGLIADMNRLGGIMAARIEALDSVGVFNEQAIAGEEPDLGVRLGLAGFSMIKLDQPMATHDAHMFYFGQWWTRAVRGGHALAYRYIRHGRTKYKDGKRELKSAIFWGFVLPISTFILLWPTRGASLLLLVSYGLLAARVYRYYSKMGLPRADALLATQFIILSKFAEFIGVLRYCVNRLRGKFHIIEYK